MLVRETGWEGAGWSAALDSLQVARAGLLRRGVVTLRARRGARSVDALTVRVWTRGLEAFGGAEGEGGAGGGEGEAAAGGLALSVGGARLRDISLFEGQVAAAPIFLKYIPLILVNITTLSRECRQRIDKMQC